MRITKDNDLVQWICWFFGINKPSPKVVSNYKNWGME